MKVTFFSNYLTHHQIPISNELYKILGSNYTFVSCQPMEEERREQGWNIIETYPYELKAYTTEKNKQLATDLARSSDVVIVGAAPREYWVARVEENKLTLKYTERYFKKTRWKLLDPREIRVRFMNDFKYRNKKCLHVLCAGAYAAEDCRLIFSYKNRLYKWGYFPEGNNKSYQEILEIKKRSNQIKILWVSRFIEWKHPMKVIKITENLIKKGYDFQITMVGTGNLEDECKAYVEKNKLSKYIVFAGVCSKQEVYKYMEESHVFLHTADRNEGWGAVINEAMSNACAIIVDKMVGAASYMIQDNQNGLLTDGTINKYIDCIEKLILNDRFMYKIGEEAYKTINEIWSPQNATINLINLMKNLLSGNLNDIADGPGSLD